MISRRAKRVCLLTLACIAILPSLAFAREFTPAEKTLIEHIALRIKEIAAQIQLLIQQRQIATNQPQTTVTPPWQADHRAPRILDTKVGISERSFSFTWKTDEPSTSRIIYGYNEWLLLTATTSTFTVSDNVLRSDHALTVPGLTASTTYYYDIEATDAAGNIFRLGQQSTSTLPRATNIPPEVTRIDARATTTTGAVITWRTNVDTKGVIYFGASYPLKPTPQTARMNAEEFFETIHSLPLTELTASTTYYFVIETTDRLGNSTITGDYSFTTKKL